MPTQLCGFSVKAHWTIVHCKLSECTMIQSASMDCLSIQVSTSDLQMCWPWAVQAQAGTLVLLVPQLASTLHLCSF